MPMSPSPAESAVPLRVAVCGGDRLHRQELASALAQALGLPLLPGQSLLADAMQQAWVAMLDPEGSPPRDALCGLTPRVKWVRLPGATADTGADSMAADEPVYTAAPGMSVARQVSGLLPRLLRAAAADAATDLSSQPNSDTRCGMHFTKVVLYTAADGRALFREEALPLTEGKPQARLSTLMPSGGLQLRMSPVGFRSDFHCTENPQWLFVLAGEMEIGLQDGSTRRFGPGQHFFSADTLPAGASFDPSLHGHCSRQVGDEPLVTAFVRS